MSWRSSREEAQQRFSIRSCWVRPRNLQSQEQQHCQISTGSHNHIQFRRTAKPCSKCQNLSKQMGTAFNFKPGFPRCFSSTMSQLYQLFIYFHDRKNFFIDVRKSGNLISIQSWQRMTICSILCMLPTCSLLAHRLHYPLKILQVEFDTYYNLFPSTSQSYQLDTPLALS